MLRNQKLKYLALAGMLMIDLPYLPYFFLHTAIAQDVKTLWISATDFVTGDPTLQISYPYVQHPGVVVTATKPGDFKWVNLGLRLPPCSEIKAIRVCYQLSNPRSFISQVRLTKMQTPERAVVLRDFGNDFRDTFPFCFFQEVDPPIHPEGAVTLALRLNFANRSDKITLGAIGIDMETFATDIANVKCFGAVGDGRSHQLSERFSTLAEAQTVYPHVESLDDEIDWAAIQAAVDYAIANSLPVTLANRTYRSNKTLQIRGDVDIREGTINYTGNDIALRVDSNPPGSIPFARNARYTEVKMTNITIHAISDGEDQPQGLIGLDLGKARRSNFTNVTVRGFVDAAGVGVNLRGSTGNRFFNCNFSENSVNLKFAAYKQQRRSEEVEGVPANDNKFWGCTFNKSTGSFSIYFPHEPLQKNGFSGNNNAFHGCWIEDNERFAVLIESGFSTSFVDCWFEDAHGSYIRLAPTKEDSIYGISIIGNTFATVAGALDTKNIIYIGARVSSTAIISNSFPNTSEEWSRIVDDRGINTHSFGNQNLGNKFPLPDPAPIGFH